MYCVRARRPTSRQHSPRGQEPSCLLSEYRIYRIACFDLSKYSCVVLAGSVVQVLSEMVISMSARLMHRSWHDVYQAAILESDRQQVSVRVQSARSDLAERLRHLDPQHPEERCELDRIANALRMLALLDKTTAAEA